MQRFRLTPVVTLVAAAALVAAALPHASAQSRTAQVRFFHAGLDIPSVDVRIGGTEVFPEVRGGELTSYRDVSVATASSTEVLVTLGGDPTRELARSSVLLAVEDRVTIALAGPSDRLGVYRYADDSPPVDRDDPRSWLRLIHLSPDAGEVDVAAEGSEQAWISGVAYGQASQFQAVMAGDYALELTKSDTGDVVHKLVSFTAPSYIATTLYMFGSREGGTIDVLVITDRPWRPTLTPTPYGTKAPSRTPAPGRTAIPSRTPSTGTGRAVVRVLHGAVGQPTLDVAIAGGAAAGGLSAGEASDYVYLVGGTQSLEVSAAGHESEALLRTRLSLRTGAYQTVVLTAPRGSLTATVVSDGIKHTGAGDTADMRFIHAAPGAATFGAHVSGGPTLASAADYLDIGKYVETPQGQCAVVARPTDGGKTEVAFPLEKLQAATGYSAYLIGDGQGENLRGVILKDSAAAATPGRPEGEARLRLMHALPDRQTVSLLVGDVEAVNSLAYGRASDYLPFTGQSTYRLKVVDSATGADLVEAELRLEKDNWYTLVAAGVASERSLTQLLDSLQVPDDGRAGLRFVSASADSPAVDATAGRVIQLASNLGFGQSGDYVDLPGGFTGITVVERATGSELVELNDVWLKPLAVYSAFLIGEKASDALDVVVIRDADFGVATPAPPPVRRWRSMLPIAYR